MGRSRVGGGGYLVSDYRDSMVPEGTPPLAGFAEGPVYVTGVFPIFTGIEPPDGAQVVRCRPNSALRAGR